uniref:VLIG-type G domain-containing protein n=1 Tax=Erpetoichthys calabaricus TaxID=27687 RepID=A0A8C4XGW1_ERPCA
MITTHFKDVGLDPAYWLPKLKEKLGISSVHALPYVGREDYEKLLPYCKADWEKRALKSVFNIKDDKSEVEKLQKERLENARKRQEESRCMLTELRALYEQGKERSDHDVKAKKQKLQTELEIPPEYWSTSTDPLKAVIENMQKQLDCMESSLQKSENLSDREIVKNASGGLALEGIYKTDKLEDLMNKREQLIDLHQSFSLAGPQDTQVFEQVEVSSHESEATFGKLMEKMGRSIAAAVKGGGWGFCLDARLQQKKSSEFSRARNSLTEKSYICTTKYNYIPLASCFINKSDLTLTKAALDELKRIEMLVMNTNDKELQLKEIQTFFDRFGSHANQGPLHFGGIYWWKASCEGFHSQETEEVRRIVSESLNTYIGASYSGFGLNVSAAGGIEMSSSEGSVTGKKKDILKSKIQLTVSKTGGPEAADQLLQWKTGLTSSSKTWSVIDRGQNLVPVWEIILSSHSTEFRNVQTVANCLAKGYKTYSGLRTSDLTGAELGIVFKEVQEVLSTIKSWNASDPEQHLIQLSELKSNLIDKTKSCKVWINECLSDPSLQNFLYSIVSTHKTSPNKNSAYIKSQMRLLLLPDIEESESFLERVFIMTWLNESRRETKKEESVKNVSQLCKILQLAKMEIQNTSSLKDLQEVKVNLTSKIAFSVFMLCKHFREMKQMEELSLLLSIVTVVGYSNTANTFNSLLDYPEIIFLHDELNKVMEKYSSLRRESILKSQAFVIITGLTVTNRFTRVTPEVKKKCLSFLESNLKDVLLEDIRNLVQEFSEGLIVWKKLEDQLNSIVNGTYQKNTKDESAEYVRTKLGTVLKRRPCSNSERNESEPVMHPLTDSPCCNVIERLELKSFYPKKLTMSDVLLIDKFSLHKSQPSSDHDVLFCFLQKLLMIDYKARHIVFKTTKAETESSEINVQTTSAISLEDFLDDPDIYNDNTDCSVKPASLHFMDVQMAVYHCSDMFLWQYITSKLSICQYALPLLVPNLSTTKIELPIWSFRPLKRSWKCADTVSSTNASLKSITANICSTPVPMVTFMRFGRCTSSKSQMMNGLLNHQKHDTFYHRDCKGSSNESLLMDGVVEISWYCPAGNKDDQFNECIAFTNLRGDARKHDRQVQFLLKTSSINVVVLMEHHLDSKCKEILTQLVQSPNPLICLYADKTNIAKGNHETKVKLGLRNRNQSELIQEVAECIQGLLTKSDVKFSIEKGADVARRLHFLVDEDDKDCTATKKMAETAVKPLRDMSLSDAKEKFIPLQGNLWHNWCDIEMEKNRLRKEQYKRAFPLNNVMREFIKNLNSQSTIRQKFFLAWLGQILNDLTSRKLQTLNEKHSELCAKMEEQKQKRQNTDIIEKEIEVSSGRLAASTLGLEHLLREVGQIYETLASQHMKNEMFLSLPQLAADLMISGHPIELMDGDASHVAITWVSSVLEQVIAKLGDKRVFVLSVLGIQSTGKSTLLNAMFGLQFAVSAGRCTRGAFMQLLKVKDENNELNFDYVLVVDTEGLKALELGDKATLKHDNELATFVIGIGNLTLINIFGENPSDMQDILQISVQAFMRMKKVKLCPSCIFVHQNVGEITAGEKNMEGRRRLLERLDFMTQTAAKQEMCDISRFTEVINFDISRHVHYFSHLWEGNPPMAPPNPRYSENIQKLKQSLFSEEMQEGIIKISEFKTRMEDLWSALLDEDFVFSFKNTLEIAAYRKVEEKYADWSWRLRSCMLEIENELRNSIENETLQDTGDFKLDEKIQVKYEAITKEMNEYFTKEKDKDLIIQWKAKTELGLKDLQSELVKGTERKLTDFIKMKQGLRKVEEQKGKYESELMKKSQDLARDLKGKNLTLRELENAFQKMWTQWVTRVKSEMPDVQPPNIKAHADAVLLENFERKLIDSCKQSKSYTRILYIDDFSAYLQMNKGLVFKHTINQQDQLCMRNLTSSIIQDINDRIKEKEAARVDYSNSFMYEVVNTILKAVNNCKCNQNRFKIKKEYPIDLALHLRGDVIWRFQEMNRAFQKVNNPLEYLENKKEDYFGCFQIYCSGASAATVLADCVTRELKKAIRQEVYNKSSAVIATEIRCGDQALNGNKSKLEKHILLSLLENLDFRKCEQYIDHPKAYYEAFIKEREKAYFSSRNPRIFLICTEKLENIKSSVSLAISKSTAYFGNTRTKATAWIERFCKELKNEIVFSINNVRGFEDQDIQNMSFFKESINDLLNSAYLELKEEFSGKNPLDRKLFRSQPHEELFRQCCGCCKKCPLCSAMCINTMPTHEGDDHCAQFHRPQTICGIKWYEFRGSKWCPTNRLVTDICSSLVASDCRLVLSEDNEIPYRDYRQAGPEYACWSITSDKSLQPFWKWFVCHFKEDLEKKYNGRLTDIPDHWKTITKENVIEFNTIIYFCPSLYSAF